MELINYLNSANKSIFRFEYLQDFDIPEEQKFFQKYVTAGVLDLEPLMKGWWDFIDAKRRMGVMYQKVKLIREPLTKYTEWSLQICKKSEKYGQKTKILTEEKLTRSLERLKDFWLIDDSVALRMNYGGRGEYLGFEKVKNIEPYVLAKKYSLKNSE